MPRTGSVFFFVFSPPTPKPTRCNSATSHRCAGELYAYAIGRPGGGRVGTGGGARVNGQRRLGRLGGSAWVGAPTGDHGGASSPGPAVVGAVVAEKGDRRSGLVGSRKAVGRQVGGDPAMGSCGDSRWAAAGERRRRTGAIGHWNTELGRGGENPSRSRRITARQIS
jgi:hypothetical protein